MMELQTMLIRWLSLTIIAGMLTSCGGPPGKPEAKRSQEEKKRFQAVEVITAAVASISQYLELTGSVEPYRTARLASPAEGPVSHIWVREGDPVKAGDSLLSIGRKEGIEALIASLQKDIKKEQENLERTRRLVQSEALPGERLDEVRSAVERIRAQLVKAKETAGDYSITAPWDGIVSDVLVREGEFTAPRTNLMELYDPSSLVIRCGIPEQHAVEIKVGMRVEARLDAYPRDILQARVTRVFPYLDPHFRTRPVEIVPDKAVDLLPGMFARLKILIKKEEDALVLPLDAVITTAEGPMVFIVEDGRAVVRMVETGIEDADRIQILTNVEPGEKVIVSGNVNLKNGVPVRPAGKESSGNNKQSERPVLPMKKQSGMTGEKK